MRILYTTFLLLFLIFPKVALAQVAKFSEPPLTAGISIVCGDDVQYVKFLAGVEEDKTGKKLRYYYKVKNESLCRIIVQWDLWTPMASRIGSNMLLLSSAEEKMIEYFDARDPDSAVAGVWIWVEQPISSYYAKEQVKNNIVLPAAGYFPRFSGGGAAGYFPAKIP